MSAALVTTAQSPEREGCEKLVDGNFYTKWLDKKVRPLIFDLGADRTTSVDGYRWVGC